jgi:hypothetical protein
MLLVAWLRAGSRRNAMVRLTTTTKPKAVETVAKAAG